MLPQNPMCNFFYSCPLDRFVRCLCPTAALKYPAHIFLLQNKLLVPLQTIHPSRVAFGQNEQSCDIFSLPPLRTRLALRRRTTFGILPWPVQENEARQDNHQKWANHHGSLNDITGFHTSDLNPRIGIIIIHQMSCTNGNGLWTIMMQP